MNYQWHHLWVYHLTNTMPVHWWPLWYILPLPSLLLLQPTQQNTTRRNSGGIISGQPTIGVSGWSSSGLNGGEFHCTVKNTSWTFIVLKAWSWGIRFGPFAVHGTYFCKIDFHFINKPHGAFPFSCIQRIGLLMMGPKSGWHKGVYDPVAIKSDHLQSTKPIPVK